MSILLAAVIVGCWMLVLFFPWAWFEDRLKGSLNSRLHPLRLECSSIRIFWRQGPGLSIEEPRLFASGSQARREPFLSAPALTLRPALESLAGREISVHLVVDTPVFRLEREEGDGPWMERIKGILAQGLGVLLPAGPGGASDAAHPASLSALVPLGGGFELTGASVRIRNGSLEAVPGGGMTGVQAFLRVHSDLSFSSDLAKGSLCWSEEEPWPLRVSANVAAEINLDRGAAPGARLAGAIRLEETGLEWRERTAAVPEGMNLSIRLEGKTDDTLSAPEILLTGPGFEMGMAGTARLAGGPVAVRIRDLRAKVQDWKAFCALFLPETTLSGTLSLAVETLEIEPGRIELPAFRRKPLHTLRPEGVSSKGFKLQIREGRVWRAGSGDRNVTLNGLRVLLEQQEEGWTGEGELTELEVKGEQALRLAGPASYQAEWSDRGSASRAGVFVELTQGRLRYSNLLDKPAGMALRLGMVAHVHPDEVRLGPVSLRLGEKEWSLEGRLEDFADPLLTARMAPGAVSLEALGEVVPATRPYELAGSLDVNELALRARLREIRKSARLRARLAGKDLRLGGTSLRGLYAKASYGEELLALSPVVIQPKTGMIELVFSADFSQTFLNAGLHQYYGTLRVDHVDLPDLAGLAAPSLPEKPLGSADLNVAFRGSGFSWDEAATGLEARARIRLDRVGFEQEDESEEALGDGLAQRVDQLLRAVDVEAMVPQKKDLIDPDLDRLINENRAAGWFTVGEGRLRTDNLVALYEGRLIQIQGSVDLAGHVQVEKGKLFSGGRMLPFRLDCMLGGGSCVPMPDPEEMERDPSEALSDCIQVLSEAARGVYGELHF
jgi:hypothetical protein